MRRHGFVFALGLFFSTFISYGAFAAPPDLEPIPHFELDMTGQEYSALLSQMIQMQGFGQKDNGLKPVLDMGKRNLDWLKFINDHRDSQHQISLSAEATQQGTPIETPRFYNPTIILRDYQALLQTVPTLIKDVVLGLSPMTTNPPVSDDQFIYWGLKLDRSYQIAARWTLMEGYLKGMAARRSSDIRGYYFLAKNANIKNELENWSSLAPDVQALYRTYLLEMCENNGAIVSCSQALDVAVSQNKVYDYYTAYFQGSKDLWDSFFTIPQSRTDVTWKNNPEEMHVPFRDPKNAKVKAYLADNIQDEWKWGQWHLFLDFQTGTGIMPEVQFQAGSTPHVNGLTGNTITMDDNAPLTEYDVQWTIRHEFGHVLGFPDCYVEFYDEANSVMISYQLDITNLMCSRRGHLKQIHYDELKRVYGKPIILP